MLLFQLGTSFPASLGKENQETASFPVPPHSPLLRSPHSVSALGTGRLKEDGPWLWMEVKASSSSPMGALCPQLQPSLCAASLAGIVGSPPPQVYVFQLQPVKSLHVSRAARIYGSCPAASLGISCLSLALELQPHRASWLSPQPGSCCPTSSAATMMGNSVRLLMSLFPGLFPVSTLGLWASKSYGQWLPLTTLISHGMQGYSRWGRDAAAPSPGA